jgi:mannan polymerase II complex MNN11 subunit
MDPDEIDFICVQDANGLNAGSFFVRNSKTAKLILDLWSERILVNFANDHWSLREQALFHHLIYNHPTLRKRIGWVNQTMINAYPDGWEGEAWQPGDLVVHFPNCWFSTSHRNLM